ncbi:Transposase [mine drainage metagenome]|uniref:Transposase n=1 Tax=mine drainage metagenome TaxID=410659 RepID=T0Y1V2_9ZZZZ
MIPPVRRTWAPVGQTPIVRHHYRRERISVIGALSVSPRRRRLGLYFRMHAKNIAQEEVYDFLWYLLRHLRGPVIVVWDGASIHDSKSLSDLLRKYPRLHLERLPAYALPNSIPSKPPGMRPSTRWPTVDPRTSTISDARCSRACATRAHRKRSCAAAYSNPNCPLFCDEHCIIYATVNITGFRKA